MGNQNASFYLGLIFGMTDTGWDNGGAVMVGHLQIGLVQFWLITACLVNSALQVIGDNTVGYCSHKCKGPGMGAGPVSKGLGPGGLGIGEVTCTHDTDK